MLSPQRYAELQAEYHALIKALNADDPCFTAQAGSTGEGFGLRVTVYRLAPPKTLRSIEITYVESQEVYAHLTDDDQTACAEWLAAKLATVHFTCKRGYCDGGAAVAYFVKPAWAYWYRPHDEQASQ